MDNLKKRSVLRLNHGECQILLCCRTGANHKERDLPCQDSCMASQHFYKGYPYTLLVVADGHGNARYTRSEVGAHLAAQAVREVSVDFVHAMVDLMEKEPASWKRDPVRHFKDHFGRAVIKIFRDKVEDHAFKVEGHAFKVEGHASKKSKKKEASESGKEELHTDSRKSIDRYGTTVTMALLFENLLFLGGVGDSAVYTVEQKSAKLNVKENIPEEKKDISDISTPSLINLNARYSWKTAVKTLSKTEQTDVKTLNRSPGISDVVMILATTDGMPDSLKDPSGSIEDICKKSLVHGLDWLEEILPGQLDEWSNNGVGDDMGVIVCFPRYKKYISQDKKNEAVQEEMFSQDKKDEAVQEDMFSQDKKDEAVQEDMFSQDKKNEAVQEEMCEPGSDSSSDGGYSYSEFAADDVHRADKAGSGDINSEKSKIEMADRDDVSISHKKNKTATIDRADLSTIPSQTDKDREEI
ncbi:MAG: protein phosphatase 2C domain-containing protein [Desulfamplus sp.]|nr:protein phosphatase 2C domain-containing protein [Desulfamplus sp.]